MITLTQSLVLILAMVSLVVGMYYSVRYTIIRSLVKGELNYKGTLLCLESVGTKNALHELYAMCIYVHRKHPNAKLSYTLNGNHEVKVEDLGSFIHGGKMAITSSSISNFKLESDE